MKMLKKLLVGIVAAAMLFVATPNANAGGAFLGNISTDDYAYANSGDDFNFLGQSAFYRSGAEVTAEGAAGSLLNFSSSSDSTAKAIGGIGDAGLYLPGFFGLGYTPGVGLTHTIGAKSEAMGHGIAKVEAEAYGFLSAAYGRVEVTAFQQNGSMAENHNLLDWDGDMGVASAYNASTATTVREKLDVGFCDADVELVAFAKTTGETISWVTVGNNYAQSGAFSGNNEFIGDKSTAEGWVHTAAQATSNSGQAVAIGNASFSGTDGFAASISTANATGGVVVATSHSHASTGGGNGLDNGNLK